MSYDFNNETVTITVDIFRSHCFFYTICYFASTINSTELKKSDFMAIIFFELKLGTNGKD